MKKGKVIIGLSGGVDSSVSTYLLLQEGYEVEGIYMKLHNRIDGYHETNIANIEKVTASLGIPYHILDLTSEFEKEVYEYFVTSYIDGITPNPCVKCNRTIKFGYLYDAMKRLGGDYLATGHYARTDGTYIYVAEDSLKDQSYFLAGIRKEVLPYVLFPMSRYTKEQIKEIAATLPALSHLALSKESQEICFVDTVYTDIIKKHTNIDRAGETLDSSGKVVGHHKGYIHYTIGKRKGFYVHGAHDPHFVLSLNKEKNQIVVGKKEELQINRVMINNLNMFIGDLEFTASVKLRYRSKETNAKVVIKDDSGIIELEDPVYGVAAGQYAAFYRDGMVLGSGVIIDTKYYIKGK